MALLRKSNPALLEWLHSPTVYREAGEDVKGEMLSPLDRKRESSELAEGPAVPVLNRYIEAALTNVDDAVRRAGWMESYAGSKVPYSTLNQVLQEAVLSQTVKL